jgi:hypothetical protein
MDNKTKIDKTHIKINEASVQKMFPDIEKIRAHFKPVLVEKVIQLPLSNAIVLRHDSLTLNELKFLTVAIPSFTAKFKYPFKCLMESDVKRVNGNNKDCIILSFAK